MGKTSIVNHLPITSEPAKQIMVTLIGQLDIYILNSLMQLDKMTTDFLAISTVLNAYRFRCNIIV